MDPVKIAIRFLYVLKHWSLDDWPVEPLGLPLLVMSYCCHVTHMWFYSTGDVDKSYDNDYLNTLRVGAFTDPVK